MTQDIETLRLWIRVVQFVAAICATIFPIVYAFSRWYASWLGRLLMLQGVALAAALDMSLIFQFMRADPNIMLRFWVYAVVLTLIAVATAALAYMVVRMNYIKHKKKELTVTDVTPSATEPKTHPLLSNKSYDQLKPLTTMVFPAVIAAWLTVAGIWDIANAEKIAGTLAALNALLGVVLAFATKAYNNSDVKFDGSVDVQTLDGVKTVVMDIKTAPEDMIKQNEVNLKVNNV